MRIEDIMHYGSQMPSVSPDDSMLMALREISEKGLGMTTVTNDHNQLVGVFTDGDLRRCLQKGMDINSADIGSVMSANPRRIKQSALAAQALNIMETHEITALIIVDESDVPVGVLHMHDLLKAGII